MPQQEVLCSGRSRSCARFFWPKKSPAMTTTCKQNQKEPENHSSHWVLDRDEELDQKSKTSLKPCIAPTMTYSTPERADQLTARAVMEEGQPLEQVEGRSWKVSWISKNYSVKEAAGLPLDLPIIPFWIGSPLRRASFDILNNIHVMILWIRLAIPWACRFDDLLFKMILLFKKLQREQLEKPNIPPIPSIWAELILPTDLPERCQLHHTTWSWIRWWITSSNGRMDHVWVDPLFYNLYAYDVDYAFTRLGREVMEREDFTKKLVTTSKLVLILALNCYQHCSMFFEKRQLFWSFMKDWKADRFTAMSSLLKDLPCIKKGSSKRGKP